MPLEQLHLRSNVAAKSWPMLVPFQDEEEDTPQPNAPTVPDEDFFNLILRLQSSRLEDQGPML
jgi:hypothetical protein